MAQDKGKPAATEEEAPPAKSKKTLLIIIIAAVLVLGGGAGGWWYFKQAKTAKPAVKEEKHEEAKAPVFMTLEAFTVNLMPEPADQYLQVEISLQLADAKDEELLKQSMPLVKSRILLILSSKKSGDISSPEGKNALSKEIIASLNQPFTPGAKPQSISGVFFTSFVIQ